MFVVDWGTVAAVTVAVAAVAGIIIQAMKKEKPWKKVQTEHDLRVTSLELQVKSLREQIEHLKDMLDDHDHRDEKDFERLENKIEKITDIMIGMLQNDKPTKPKPRSTRIKAKK